MEPETSNFFQIGVISGSMITSSIIRKVFWGISGNDYFQNVLTEHITKSEACIPGPEYTSWYFLCRKGILSSREERVLTSHSSAAPILVLVSQSSLLINTSMSRISRNTVSISNHFRSQLPAPVSQSDRFRYKARSIYYIKRVNVKGRVKSVLPPRNSTSSPTRNSAVSRLEPSPSPCLLSRAVSTPVTDSIDGHLSGLIFSEFSLPINSDPESPRGVEPTLVAKESQHDATEQHRQTKVSTSWKLMPANLSDTRFDLYFNNVKIQGIQMESFEIEADIDAGNDKVCAYGCKSAAGKRQWLTGIKYTSRYVHVLIVPIVKHLANCSLLGSFTAIPTR